MTTSHQTPAATSSRTPGGVAAGPPFPSPGAHLRGGKGSNASGVQDPLPPGLMKLACAMSESELERQVRRMAADLGLLLFHAYDSRRSPPGFPDLVCVGRSVMFRELKKQNGRTTTAQKDWLRALEAAGADAGVWKPAALLSGRVAKELAALAGMRRA